MGHPAVKIEPEIGDIPSLSPHDQEKTAAKGEEENLQKNTVNMEAENFWNSPKGAITGNLKGNGSAERDGSESEEVLAQDNLNDDSAALLGLLLSEEGNRVEKLHARQARNCGSDSDADEGPHRKKQKFHRDHESNGEADEKKLEADHEAQPATGKMDCSSHAVK